jgi:DNA-binding MarR family transcriptional regulator/GNAT superfamily N-acetyltransferase
MSQAMPAPLEARVEAVRRFNRLWTRTIGVLQEGYLKSPFSLTEVRVLYELAHRQRATATELARELELDPGYLSRILAGFLRRDLLERQPSDRDGRETWLSLSSQGQQVLAPLEWGAREQTAELLGRLPDSEQQHLVGALQRIERLLAAPASGSGYIIRSHRAGDMGWVVQRHGALYFDEYGFDESFEALVAGIVAKFIEHLDPERERCWIAERDGRNLGCVFLVRATRRTAKLRLFLVEPDARGLGIGRHLVDELIRFARSVGYYRIRLWTQSNLLAARRIYEKVGFVLIDEDAHHSFSQDLVAETWELRLF